MLRKVWLWEHRGTAVIYLIPVIIRQLCFRMSRALAANLIIAVPVGSDVLPTANHEASDVVFLSHANFERGVTNLQRSSPS